MSNTIRLEELNEANAAPRPIIRAACVLIEDGRILLVKQEVTTTRHWALPGGKLDMGETLSDCIAREMAEETGLSVKARELLYVTDRILAGTHVVHMSFLVDRSGDESLPHEWRHLDPHPSSSSDSERLVRMAGVDELGAYGFSPVFCRLVKDGFPGRGSYKGDFRTFYGE